MIIRVELRDDMFWYKTSSGVSGFIGAQTLVALVRVTGAADEVYEYLRELEMWP